MEKLKQQPKQQPKKVETVEKQPQKVEDTVRCYKTLENGERVTTTFNKIMWERIKKLFDNEWKILK